MKHKNTPDLAGGLTKEEMAAQLGISPRTVRRRVKEGQLRMAKIRGQYLYFLVDDSPQLAAMAGGLDGAAANSAKPDTTGEKKKKNQLAYLPTAKGGQQLAAVADPVAAAKPETVPLELYKQAQKRIQELLAAMAEVEADLAATAAKLESAEEIRELEKKYLLDKIGSHQKDVATREVLQDQLKTLGWWQWKRRRQVKKELLVG